MAERDAREVGPGHGLELRSMRQELAVNDLQRRQFLGLRSVDALDPDATQ